jgi:GNAT superfamily N-acetyltransferase
VQLSNIAEDWTKKLPRYPVVPSVRLGRLAVDVRYQGKKLGAAMLCNAICRALRSEIAAHMMVVEAKNEPAANFYIFHGFRSDPDDPLRLYAGYPGMTDRILSERPAGYVGMRIWLRHLST